MTAHEHLSSRLAALADAGTPPPCAGRIEWTSDDVADQEAARRECPPCPVVAECHAAAVDLGATAGTWAGLTYGTSARRKATA